MCKGQSLVGTCDESVLLLNSAQLEGTCARCESLQIQKGGTDYIEQPKVIRNLVYMFI